MSQDQSPRAGDGRTLTAEQVEKLAAAEGVKFQRVYRPGNKAWTDITTGAVELGALTRIVSAALAAAPAAAPAATLTLTGEMHTMGDMGADDMPQPETPRVVVGLADGRNLMVIGLTRDEVVALAPHFLERVTVQVGAGFQAPATESGSQS